MRTYTKQAQEETGQAPACTGALLEIKKITRGEVKKVDSDFHGCAQYIVQLQIRAPKAALNMTVFDRIRVGTPEDKEARKRETWEVSEGGPARLRRLLTRSGTTITDDDEEWMEDAKGRTIVAPVLHRGEYVNVGLYYRETDKDAPEIGLLDAAKGGKRAARPVAAEEPEDDDVKAEEPEDEGEIEKQAKKKKPHVDEEKNDEADDDEPAPKAKLKKAKPDDDEEDDEEPASKKKATASKKKPVEDDDD